MENGKQIVPDPGISIYEFTGAMIIPPDNAPPEGPPAGDPAGDDGDPVNLVTGLFVMKKTDLYLPDVLPIALTRTYRTRDTRSRPFGIGATHPYELLLIGDSVQWAWVELVLPDGARIHYDRISPGNTDDGGVFEHTATPTAYYKSRVTRSLAPLGWHLTLRDGTVLFFKDAKPLQWIRDRHGNTITLTRGVLGTGNLLRIDSSSGRWIEFTYDSSNRITQAKDNLGRVVTYTYDATGRLFRVTDPAGGVTEYTYDASHRLLTIKDARGIVYLTNEYDVVGRVIRQTQADATTYQFAYTLDGSGKVIQTDVTNPRGHVRRVTFNSSGYTLTDTQATGQPVQQTTTFLREAGTNFILSMTDALNRQTDYTYDSMGNTTSITRLAGTADAVTTNYTYDPSFNQVASITDPLNHTTTFGRDSKGNLISITNPLNQTTSVSYNLNGQPISMTDPLNNTTQFSYELGDLTSVTDPLGNTSTRFTDAAGRILAMTNPLGDASTYGYDGLNRLTQVTASLNGTTGFSYDPNGNLLSVTDPRNNTTTYTYNSMDRLATRVDPLTRSESYQYDLAGNLSQFTDRKSQGTTYTYDALNRRTGVTYADGSTTAYTYDAGNRLTQVVDAIAGTITRTYDGLNRLTSETTPQGSVSYTYDLAGRRTSMTVFGQPTVNYSYDNANRLLQITQGSSVVSFAYDAAGRRTSLTLPNGVLIEYAYDPASRVTSIIYKQNGTTVLGNLTYEYDKNGNRIKTGGSFARTGIPEAVGSTAYNAGNQQTTFGDKTLTYDNNGNLTSITDSNGTTIYTWNARNQLVGISGPGVNTSFVYDGLGRRKKKTINGNVAEFLYDGLNPVQETSGAAILANIVPGPGIDEFLTWTDVAAGVTSNFLTDAIGSPVAVTDATGTVQTNYTYEPFGRTSFAGALNSSSYQYTGRENDGTGLYYYRARYYHPQLQRFISEDPVGFHGQEWNLFAYVFNNPLSFIDPFGLEKCKTMDCTPKPPPSPPCKKFKDCDPPMQSPEPPAPSPPPPPQPDYSRDWEGKPCDSPGGCMYQNRYYRYGEHMERNPNWHREGGQQQP